ncbi:MAG: hypothetical protein Q9182_004589 [Xanthomendoza sp. 2 TL-2023]
MFQFFSTLIFLLSIRAARSAVEPAPIVLQTTGHFSGIDGAWSTFKFAVGTPPQNFELLPSTQIPESWVVLDIACTSQGSKNCSDSRGGTFSYQDSSTWSNKSIYALGAEANLGYTDQNGFFGWDNVALTTPEGAKTTVNHTVVAGIVTNDSYLGALGLAQRPVVWEDHSDSAPSLISILKEKSLIPNLSYGYTAGASYKSAPASLTIGGYDTSRFTPNDVSFAFGPLPARQLLVSIQAISVTNSKAQSDLLTQGITALIDSTVPHIWLPELACKAFEAAFGIKHDPIKNLYLVDNDQHNAMVKQDAKVTFQLGTSLNGGAVVKITLPYASFDLEAAPPFVKSQTRYFPLRRAKDETQYTLGRVFLQEAFIVVDYDHSKFSVSQALYTQGAPSHIVVTSAEGSTNTTTTDSTSGTPPLTKTSSGKAGGLGTGAIAGIAAAIVVLLLLATSYCLWRFRFKKNPRDRKVKAKADAELEDTSEPKGVQEAFNKRRLSGESVRETKEAAKIHTEEVSRNPPAELEGGGPSGRLSNRTMSMETIGRAELPSPDPFKPHELESIGIMRSELSTPEPPSELSTSDRNLVAEFPSPDMVHELSTSNRDSRIRPTSYRNNSVESDIISPQDSASIRPNLHDRKNSQDTIPTPTSPTQQRPSLRFGPGPRRHSGQRPNHIRLHSSSSHDTFETRFNEFSTPPGGNTPSLPPPQPLEPYGARSNSFRFAHGSASPLASPPLGSQPSPSLSAFNSPTLASTGPRFPDQEPQTPNLELSSISTEREPLMNQSPGFRSTRFAEDLTGDPETMTREESERERRDEAEKGRVKTEVEKFEDRARREGK